MKIDELFEDSYSTDLFADVLGTKFFELRKDHLETFKEALEIIPGVEHLEYNQTAQEALSMKDRGRLRDSFEGCGFKFMFHGVEADAFFSNSGFSIMGRLFVNGNPKIGTNQVKTFNKFVDELTKSRKALD